MKKKSLVIRLLKYLYPYRYFIVLAMVLMIFAKAVEAYIPIYIGFVTEEIFKQSALNYILQHCFIILGLLLFTYIFDAGQPFLVEAASSNDSFGASLIATISISESVISNDVFVGIQEAIEISSIIAATFVLPERNTTFTLSSRPTTWRLSR